MLYFSHFCRTFFSLILSVVLSLALGILPRVSAAEEGGSDDAAFSRRDPFEFSELQESKALAYAPGELVVKLKPGASLAELEPLNQQFGVTASDPVFPKATDPKEHLTTLKQKLATLAPGHEGWSWYTDKDSQEAKDYTARIAKEREELQQQIQAQEELIERLNRRQARAPEGAVAPALDTTYLFKGPESADILALAKAYAQHPAVEYAEPNYRVTAQLVPNDPYYPELWGLKAIQTETAWDQVQGANVIVAVVDTGLDFTHPDLSANVWTNPREIAGNGKDDDRNGYADDVRGWGYGDLVDRHGHGTHVAGTIAAVGQNGLGVIGVAHRARVMAVKVLDDDGGGWADDVAAGIRYAANQAADVINCSLVGASSNVEQDAVAYAVSKGAVVIAAAGNKNRDAQTVSPANAPDAIAVAATTSQDTKADFSNYGPVVAVAAPGVGILSLRAAGTTLGRVVGERYCLASGTSMAAPHVAGVAALLLGRDPALSTAALRRILIATTDPFPKPPKFPLGAGRLNAGKAVTTPQSPVLRVTGVQVTDSDGDGFLAPGDEIRIAVTLKNLWRGAVAVSGTLSVTSGPATVTRAAAAWGGLATDQERANTTAPFVIRLGAAQPAVPVITGVLTTQADGVAQQLPVSFEMGVKRVTGTASMAYLGGLSPVAAAGETLAWIDERHIVNRAEERTDLYALDLATGREQAVPPTPSGSFTQVKLHPAVAGATVTWFDYRDGTHEALYARDLKTGVERLLVSGPDPDWTSLSSPPFRVISASDEAVVWQGRTNGRWDIKAYQWKTGAIQAITNDAAAQQTPAISGTQVVWTDYRHLDPATNQPQADIYLYDLAAPERGARRLTSDPASQIGPAIAGNYVVWQDNRHGQWDIYLYDLTTNRERRLTTDPADQVRPTVAGTRVAWEDWKDGDHIVLYNLDTSQAVRVTSLPGNERPVLTPQVLAWHRGPEVLAVRTSSVPSDLVASDVWIVRPTPTQEANTKQGQLMAVAGSELVFYLVTKNKGPGDAGSSRISMTINSRPHHQGMMRPGIKTQGEGMYQPPPWVATQAGTYTLTFTVNDDRQITERDYTNNTKTVQLIVQPPPPELVASGVWFHPNLPTNAQGQYVTTAGSPINLSLVMNNTGQGNAGRCSIAVTLDGQPYHQGSVSSVARQTTSAYGMSGITTLTAGVHTLTFSVNADRRAPERDYTNNTKTIKILVQPQSSRSSNRPPQILYAGAFRWWGYCYAYTFARDPEDGYIYNWGQYRWSLNGAQASGWYLFQRFASRGPVQATVTVTDRHGASASRSVTAW